jgi:ABC-type Na+ efflux pump permease subunit
MKTIRTVFLKEIVDNFRDRRTLVSALLMGPLFGPILFALVINLSVSQSLENAEEALDLPVITEPYRVPREPKHQYRRGARDARGGHRGGQSW